MASCSKYKSTRGGVEGISFEDAVFMGLAEDGGLLIPESLPDFSGMLSELAELDYPSLTIRIMRQFVGDIPQADLEDLVRRSYATFDTAEVVPLQDMGNGLHLAELFHGPTLAFKDVALQFLGNLYEYALRRRGGKLNVLGATSGDTGSAAIHGLRGKEGINIFIMYPDGRVSPLQERQMATVPDANVHCLAIQGTFDDGQSVLKEVFNDLDFKREFAMGSVNSVNWARIMAQITYYFWGTLQINRRKGRNLATKLDVAVPTGNFGDIFAGFLAKRMGAPIERLILATNENDILSRFFNSGVYAIGEVHPTISPSMDIQVASNFERYLFYRCGEDTEKVKKLMNDFKCQGQIKLEGADPDFVADCGNTNQTLATIRRYWQEKHYLLDPHSAVAVTVAERLRGEREILCLCTAHPAKFPAAIEEAIGEAGQAKHPALEALLSLPLRKSLVRPELSVIEDFIRKNV